MTVAELFAKLGLKVDGKSFSAGEKMIGGIKTALTGLAAYASTKFLGGLVSEVANAADALDEMAQKTGVPIEELQEMGYAASFSGVSLEEMGSTLGKLARNMDAAKRGSKQQASAFRAAGVAIKDSAGRLRPVQDVFDDFADKIASMPDGTQKTALAMRVLGRSGAGMIPVLNEGREGLAKLRQEFKDSGAEISGESAQAFAKFNDDQDRLKNTITGVKRQLVTALLPAMQGVLTKVLEWVKANRQLLVAKLTSALRTLGSVLSTLYRVFAPIVTTIYRFAEGAVIALDKMGALKAVLVGAAAAIAYSWMAALSPFALLAVAIAGVALLVEDLYQAFNGGDSVIGEAWTQGITFLRAKFDKFFGEIEKRAVALGLIKGEDLVSQDIAEKDELRTGKGFARVNGADSFRRSFTPSRAPQSWGELVNPSSIPSQLQAEADQRASGLRAGSAVALQQFGLGAAVPRVTPAPQAPVFRPTVNINGIKIDASAANPQEIAWHIGQELDKQIRTLDFMSGAKATP